MPWKPTPIAPTRGYDSAAERAREKAASTSEGLDEGAALKELVAEFDFHATGVKVMSGPYAHLSDPIVPCTQMVNTGKCGLAVRKGKNSCAFHENPGRFAAIGYGVDDIHVGAPAVEKIRQRHAALKL